MHLILDIAYWAAVWIIASITALGWTFYWHDRARRKALDDG